MSALISDNSITVNSSCYMSDIGSDIGSDTVLGVYKAGYRQAQARLVLV